MFTLKGMYTVKVGSYSLCFTHHAVASSFRETPRIKPTNSGGLGRGLQQLARTLEVEARGAAHQQERERHCADDEPDAREAPRH